MCAPKAPNAMDTAAASNASNLFTATAQSYLNNGQSQTTPFGSVSSQQNGFTTIKGPNGEEYQIPKFNQTTTLSGNQQNLLNVQEGVQQQLLNTASKQAVGLEKTLGQGINQPSYQQFQGGPNLQTKIGSGGNIQNSIAGGGNIQKQIAGSGDIQMQLGDQDSWGRVQDVENALFARYNPQLEQDRTRLETQLANQGVRLGSTAWNQAMDSQNRNVNDARLGITINAGQEQNRMQQIALNSGNFANSAQAQQYGQNANNAQFANSAQAQQFGQNAAQGAFTNAAQAQRYGQNANNAAFGNAAMQQGWQNNFNTTQANNGLQDSRFANQLAGRNQLVNEQSALMGGGQVGMPQFSGQSQTQVAGTDVGSLINQQYQQQLAQNNNMWGGIGQAASAALPFVLSDRRAKKDIKKLGSMAKGVGVYSYTYKGDNKPKIGVMAQEAEKVVPSAVRTRPDGYKEVNYPRLTMALGV